MPGYFLANISKLEPERREIFVAHWSEPHTKRWHLLAAGFCITDAISWSRSAASWYIAFGRGDREPWIFPEIVFHDIDVNQSSVGICLKNCNRIEIIAKFEVSLER